MKIVKVAIIRKRIADIEAVYLSLTGRELTLKDGWNQVENVDFIGGRLARQRAIQAAFYYGQWRALHDLIGSPYGYEERISGKTNE